MCGIVGYLGNRQATDVLVDGLSKLEYMLAGLYLKKGRTMYKELADEGLFNSKDIYDSIPEFKLNTDSFLVPKFVEFIETKIEEEEYIPNYILDIQEDLSNKYEKRIDKMLVENRLGYK